MNLLVTILLAVLIFGALPARRVGELPQYRGPGPVLHAITVEPAEKAKEDIVYFN